MGVAKSTLSYHLKRLRGIKVIDVTKMEKEMVYRVEDADRVADLLIGIQESLSSDAVDRFADIWNELGEGKTNVSREFLRKIDSVRCLHHWVRPLHHKRLDLRGGIEVQVVKMAHKISVIMIAAFATLAVASLIAIGASAAMTGQGVDLSANGNGDCDRTMDKLHAQNCTCDGTGPHSGAAEHDPGPDLQPARDQADVAGPPQGRLLPGCLNPNIPPEVQGDALPSLPTLFHLLN